jgi:hypothetical protein
MKQEKDKWIEEVLGSSKNLKRAEASPFLLTRVKEKLKESTEPVRNIIPAKRAWIFILTFAVLLIFNLELMLNSSSSQSSDQEIYRVAKSYSLLPDNSIYQNK